MRKAAVYLACRMRTEQLITPEDYEWYVYSIEIILEKIIGYLTILIIGMFFGVLGETITFLIYFAGIRKYSGGFHMNHFYSCFLMSIGTYLAWLFIWEHMKIAFTKPVLLAVIVISILILVIGAVNNANIDWNEKEYAKACKLTRYAVFLETGILILLFLEGIKESYLWFMSAGLTLAFLGLIMGKISAFKMYSLHK